MKTYTLRQRASGNTDMQFEMNSYTAARHVADKLQAMFGLTFRSVVDRHSPDNGFTFESGTGLVYDIFPTNEE